LTAKTVLPVCLPVALAASLSLLAGQVRRLRRGDAGLSEVADEITLSLAEIDVVHYASLRLLIGVMLLASFGFLAAGLSPLDIELATVTFAAVFAGELIAACRWQQESRVWLAELIAAVAVIYFAIFGVISFGSGRSMFIVLGAAFVAWAGGQIAARHPKSQLIRGPLTQTALVLPLVSVLLGVRRHLVYEPGDWL